MTVFFSELFFSFIYCLSVCLYVYLPTYDCSNTDKHSTVTHPSIKSGIHPSFQLSFHPCMMYCLITAGVRAPLLLLMMMPSFLSQLSDDLQILFLSLWLDVRSLSSLDVAISCHRLRPYWMTILQCLRSPAVDDWGHSLSSLLWLSRRGIRASRMQMKMDIREYVSAIHC